MNLAFVVGCGDQYRDPAVDTKVGKLSYAGNDAVGFASALRSTCGFAPESISLFVEHDDPAVAVRSEVVTKPERRAIFAAISGHSGRGLYPSPIDLLVFFFSGHGFRSSRDAREYLVPVDAIAGDPESTSIAYSAVVDNLQSWGAQRVLMFIDACRDSGAAYGAARARWEPINPSAFRVEGSGGLAVFWACAPGERSYEAPGRASEDENGIFTLTLCEALSDVGMCATVQEIDDYLRSHVPRLCSRYHRPVQNPVCRAEPLSVRSSFVASPEKRREWGKAVLLRRDITPAPSPGNEAPASESNAVPLCAIDFGTSYSSVAHLDEATGRVQLIPGPEGTVLIPSVVAFMNGRGYMTGATAVEYARTHPQDVIFHVKRDLATATRYRIFEWEFTPEEVTACVLRSLARSAQAHLKSAHLGFIISMPANFSIAQSNSLARACDLAGLEVRRTIAEPSAASLVLYRPDLKDVIDLVQVAWRSHHGRELMWMDSMIIDLGGGTLDVSVVEMTDSIDPDSVGILFAVIAVAGDVRLGGIDYDEAVYMPAREFFLSKMGPGARLSTVDEIQIRREAERAKIALGTRDAYSLTLANVEDSSGGLVNLEWEITRHTFRALTKSLDARVKACILRATELSRFMREPTEPGIIMLAGQGTKVFTVREIVEELFRGIPVIYHFQETAVVHGVGNYVGQLNGFWKGDLLLVDAFPLGIGLMRKPTPPVPRKWRDASDREWEVTPVSGKRTENTDTLELIHNGRTIPMESRNYVEPVNHDGTITLELVQFENLSGESSPIGKATIPVLLTCDLLEVSFRCDANRTALLEVRDVGTGKEDLIQVTNLFTKGRYEAVPILPP